MSSLLLEIGVEELPASFGRNAVAELEQKLLAGLVEARIAHGAARRFATPRRLAVWVEDVAERSSDMTEERTGPPVRVAFDKDGAPTKAAEKFAEKANLPIEEVGRITTDKGEYLYAEIRHEGEPSSALLPAIMRAAVALEFPKSMRWGNVEQSFARPLRWICALHGRTEIGFDFADVRSG